jgi:predicted DCC family thiol-disulfide oxidoreductase YuxK
MRRLPTEITLIFDGACGFCMRSVRLIRALDRDGRVTTVPYQRPGTPEAYGLTAAQCEATIRAVTSEGEHHSGAAAINAALAVALGSRLPLWLYRAPGIEQLQDLGYAFIARNRRRLPGDAPYCKYPGGCR